MHIAQNKLFFILIILAFLNTSIFAKPKNNGVQVKTSHNTEYDSELDENLTKDVEWQILEWDEQDPKYVYKYDVTIEQLDPKTEQWILVNTLSTKSNETRIQVQPYLFPGVYRFKVITYDLFGFPSVESDWYNFNIFEAFLPELKDINVSINLSNTIFLDEYNDGIFNANGKNLFTLPEGETDINYTEYFLIPINRRTSHIEAKILEHDDKNTKLKLAFDLADLNTGSYHLVARDASGLESDRNSGNEVNIKFKKAVDLDINAGYAFPVLILDDLIPQYLDTRIFPISGTIKADFIPFKNTWGYLGIGATGFYTFNVAPTQEYTITGNTISGFANFVFQKPFYTAVNPETGKRRHCANIEFRGGGGVTMLNNFVFHFPHDIESEAYNKMLYGFDVGFSGQWYISTRLFLDGSLDYLMTFGDDIMVGMIVPSVSIGWQF